MKAAFSLFAGASIVTWVLLPTPSPRAFGLDQAGSSMIVAAIPSGHPGPAKDKHAEDTVVGAPPDHSGHGSGMGSTTEPTKGAGSSESWFGGGGGLYAPPFYDTFKGIDLAGLTPVQKERFVHWVNTEFCVCHQPGCTRDTIANCYTNDPTCPWAPARIREILAKVKTGALQPGSASVRSAPPPSSVTPKP